MRRWRWLIGTVAALSAPSVTIAQEVPPPQSAAVPRPVAVPDLTGPEKDLGDPRKYWVLHKPGVTLDQARADLSFCWQFVPHGVQRPVPGFVPWRKADPTRPVVYDGGQFGLVGLAIAAIISGPLERSIRQSRMFRCMVPRGYVRYRVTEDMWKQIYQAEPREAIAILSTIASGPTPTIPRAEP